MSKRLDDIKVKMAEVRAAADAIKDAVDAAGGDWTDEQQSEFDAHVATFESLNADLEAETKREDENRKRLANYESLSTVFDSAPGPRAGYSIPGQRPVISQVHDTRDDDDMCGYPTVASFARDVRDACAPGGGGGYAIQRLRGMHFPGIGEINRDAQIQAAPTNYMNEGTGSDGGFEVPPAVRDTVFELIFAEEGLLNMVDLEPTESNSVELRADEWTPWGTTGTQARWRADGAQLTNDKAQLADPRILRLNHLDAYVLATDDLLEDAPRLENRLTVQAARAISYKADDAIVNGNGVGQPLGWFTSSAKVSVGKESGQSADTIVAANVVKMLSRLLPQDLANAFWLLNPDALPQVMTMTLGDNGVFALPNEGFRNAPAGFLLGRPVRLSQHAKTVGDQGDIQLVSPRGYYATMKSGGVQAARSIHLYFDYGITAFRWTFRIAGTPYLSSAVSPDNGSNTLSHFVVLDARA